MGLLQHSSVFYWDGLPLHCHLDSLCSLAISPVHLGYDFCILGYHFRALGYPRSDVGYIRGVVGYPTQSLAIETPHPVRLGSSGRQ
jgi:hypothetical protein